MTADEEELREILRQLDGPRDPDESTKVRLEDRMLAAFASERDDTEAFSTDPDAHEPANGQLLDFDLSRHAPAPGLPIGRLVLSAAAIIVLVVGLGVLLLSDEPPTTDIAVVPPETTSAIEPSIDFWCDTNLVNLRESIDRLDRDGPSNDASNLALQDLEALIADFETIPASTPVRRAELREQLEIEAAAVRAESITSTVGGQVLFEDLVTRLESELIVLGGDADRCSIS